MVRSAVLVLGLAAGFCWGDAQDQGMPLTTASHHTTTINGQEYQIPITGQAQTYYVSNGQLAESAPAPQTHYMVSQEANKEFLQNCLGTCQGEGPECAQGCHAAAQTLTGMAGQEFRNIQQIQSNIANSLGLRGAQEGTTEYIPARPTNVPQPRQPWAQGGQPQWNGRQWVQSQPAPGPQTQFQSQSTFGGLVPAQSQPQQSPNLPSGTPHIKAAIPKFGVPVLTMEDFNSRYGGSRFGGGRFGGAPPKFGQVLNNQHLSNYQQPNGFGIPRQFGGTGNSFGGGAPQFGGGAPRFAAPAAQFGGGASAPGFRFGTQGISGLRGGFFKRRK